MYTVNRKAVTVSLRLTSPNGIISWHTVPGRLVPCFRCEGRGVNWDASEGVWGECIECSCHGGDITIDLDACDANPILSAIVRAYRTEQSAGEKKE